MKLYFEHRYIFKKKLLHIAYLIIIICFFFYCAIFILTRFKPVFQEKAVLLAKQRATEILNSAAIDVFSGIESNDYVNISKKDTGEISVISSNSIEMNKLKAEISRVVSEKANAEEFFYIHIPVGSLTKYPVLQGMGYRIPIKVALDGVTKTDFKEEFTQAGINQVKNKIYIIVSAKISIISSIMTVSEVVSTEIPVSETIVIGDVPNYFGDRLGVVGR